MVAPSSGPNIVNGVDDKVSRSYGIAEGNDNVDKIRSSEYRLFANKMEHIRTPKVRYILREYSK